jgi:hypothetical protein
MKILLPFLVLAALAVSLSAQQGKKKPAAPPKPKWDVQKLHHDNNEGIAVGDVNGDGKIDVTAGEYWYPAPGFEKKKVRRLEAFGKDYLQNNGEYLLDVDADGDLDIVAGMFTKTEVFWYENAGKDALAAGDPWPAHLLVDTETGHNEMVFFHDLDGDGSPEWIENSWKADNPIIAWKLSKDGKGKPSMEKHVISETRNGHGMGFGDIDGDGKVDVVFNQGWCRQPDAGAFSGLWEYHPDIELPHSSCPVLVIDLNGDKRNDLIWADGHNYGLYWEEQLEPRADGTTLWKQHLIDKKFSQGHALAWDDIDNDGAQELITGKRYYAHSGGDPGAEDPVVVLYFDWDPNTQTFSKNVISQAPADKPSEGPGIGLQIRVADMDNNGWNDIVTSGKSGTHIIWNRGF